MSSQADSPQRATGPDSGTHTHAALFRGSVDCVKVLDLDGQLQLINPGGVISLELESAGQLDGVVWWTIWPTPGDALAEQAFRSAAQGEACSFTAACPTARGSERWWDVTVSPVHDADGRIENVLVVSRDVTELRQARAALELASLRKDEILETVAHELRNPLSAASSASQLLAMHAHSPADVARFALLIHRQLGHIGRITEDLLDSARIARGELGVKMGQVDVNSVVQIATEQLRAGAGKKGQRLDVTMCVRECEVKGDEARLVQAVGNLIANAVRYSPEHTTIDVRVVRTGAFIDVVVTDSGAGIAPERLDGLFDRYTRVQEGTGRGVAGLGLGLSLVKAIVELHEGSVSVKSAGVEKGSSFAIRLRNAVAQPDGTWLISYRTPEGSEGTLQRWFKQAPDAASAALAIKDSLLPRPLPIIGSPADVASLSLRLLQGLGYRITGIQALH